ncbi:hypothetical protein jhhlp_007511 [Lomentospora prolificans]|uniref:DUF3669 domain-containing protein n=1 Tax=Lomentospora prolificans TaxID=41688 RepID=A0A2N3N184_9PEZI|nr:hypothetical protein jhhlp_007511 [Lomentospora prolificans]
MFKRNKLPSDAELQAAWDTSSPPEASGESGTPDVILDSTSNSDDVGIRINRELKRMLTISTEITTTSTNAEYDTEAQAHGATTFRKIGAGACGVIFAQDGKSVVAKLGKVMNGDLRNDYEKHKSIARAFHELKVTSFRIPDCYEYTARDDGHYFNDHPELVEAATSACNLPTDVLVTERILPLPKATRVFLIDKYCHFDTPQKQKAKQDPANNDCLVRVYLGLPRGWHTGRRFFSLRNFKMHLDQMRELDLDVHSYARRMGDAMAIMHWAAKTDARDIEFVLGSSTTGVAGNENFLKRTTQLWLLDFNQVRNITMDEDGVAMAIDSAVVNDPYIPRPIESGKEVWGSFVCSYLRTAHVILQMAGESNNFVYFLPQKFINGFAEACGRKSSQASDESQEGAVGGVPRDVDAECPIKSSQDSLKTQPRS